MNRKTLANHKERKELRDRRRLITTYTNDTKGREGQVTGDGTALKLRSAHS
jgi:hypothetical protein